MKPKIRPFLRAWAALTFFIWAVPPAPAQAQQIMSMDFRNQNITDILLVLAEASGTSILPDETVGGTASFHFTDSALMDALDAFLSGYKLYHKREGTVIRVSRIDTSWNEEQKKISMRAEDVDIESLIKALGRAINTSILYDPLPKMPLTVDMANLDVQQALGILTLRLPGYTLEETETYYYIRHTPPGTQAAAMYKSKTLSGTGTYMRSRLSRGGFRKFLRSFSKRVKRNIRFLPGPTAFWNISILPTRILTASSESFWNRAMPIMWSIIIFTIS